MNEQDLDFNPNIKTKHRLIEEEPDELGRRKWKLEHYEEEEGPKNDLSLLNTDPRSESFLIGRTEKLAINSKIGRGEALKKTRKDGGFFCQVCKELYKCDSAYLTHLNSASHNRKLGMSLKVEGVGPESVRNKLQSTRVSDVVLSQKRSSKPSAMDQIMNKAARKYEKQEQKDEQKHLRAQKQQVLKIQKRVESHEEQQKRAETGKEEGSDIQNEQINASTLQLLDETELMMKAMGLPTSFGRSRGSKH